MIYGMSDDQPDEPRTYVTKSGRVLTDADIEALADEAERGYDVTSIRPRLVMHVRDKDGMCACGRKYCILR